MPPNLRPFAKLGDESESVAGCMLSKLIRVFGILRVKRNGKQHFTITMTSLISLILPAAVKATFVPIEVKRAALALCS